MDVPSFFSLKLALGLIADLRRVVTAAQSYGRLGKYVGTALPESGCQSCCVGTWSLCKQALYKFQMPVRATFISHANHDEYIHVFRYNIRFKVQ
jgi:hypothetical protein